MAGIYLHIPFCKQACHYCDFHFSTSVKAKEALVNAMLKEFDLRQDYLSLGDIETIYFGGGTPSILSKEELQSLLDKIKSQYRVETDAEVTLEANPDDLTEEKLQELKALGINRLSIGIQSFFDEDLKFMNRVHTANEAENCVRLARQKGFGNITIDLIYGIPGMSDERWKQNLDKAIALGVQHISSYCLTVEEGTALHKFVATGKAPAVDEEQAARQFTILVDTLEAAGYRQYEISNFAKEGMESKHNSSYWKQAQYLGIGPSAHSFNGTSRQWNVANNIKYIKTIEEGQVPAEVEVLSKEQQFNEYLLTGLRTTWGIDLNYIKQNWGDDTLRKLIEGVKPYAFKGQLMLTENNVTLTKAGRLFADRIASDLFKA